MVRAVAIATGRTWNRVHYELCELSREYCTMPSVNWLWGLYLERHGFERFSLPESCPGCVTVREFCRRYPDGVYVIGTGNHAVTAIDGDWLDVWDSGVQQVFPQQTFGQQYQQSQTAMPQTQQGAQAGQMIWVDGEVGAKAFQMPAGWPANQPIALWDTNDTVIYLKSINPMGMPNPLQKARYMLEEYKSASPANREQSGDAAPDMTGYVRKDDMERMKQELMDAISSVSTGGNAVGNGNGNGTGANKRTAKEA